MLRIDWSKREVISLWEMGLCKVKVSWYVLRGGEVD